MEGISFYACINIIASLRTTDAHCFALTHLFSAFLSRIGANFSKVIF